MKRFTVFITLVFVIVLIASLSCTSRVDERQLARIEAQLQALSTTLNATQQELASTKQSLSEAQNKTTILQQQLQEAQQAQATTCTYQEPVVQTVTVVPEQYAPSYYYPHNSYPYYPPTPPMPPTPPPPPFPPPPPAPMTSPFIYNGSVVWPNGWGNGQNKVETYDPTNPAHQRISRAPFR